MLYQQNIHCLLFFLRLQSQCKDVSAQQEQKKNIPYKNWEKYKLKPYDNPNAGKSYYLFVCVFFGYFFLYCTELNLTFFQNFIFGNLENQYNAHGKLAVLASPITIL